MEQDHPDVEGTERAKSWFERVRVDRIILPTRKKKRNQITMNFFNEKKNGDFWRNSRRQPGRSMMETKRSTINGLHVAFLS